MFAVAAGAPVHHNARRPRSRAPWRVDIAPPPFSLIADRPVRPAYVPGLPGLIEGKPVEDPVFTGLDECTKDTVDTCIQK